MATPHVTGAAVIYKTMFPKATPAQVRMALEAVGTYDWKTNTDPDNIHEPAVWIGQFRAMPDFVINASITAGVDGARLDPAGERDRYAHRRLRRSGHRLAPGRAHRHQCDTHRHAR